MTVPAWIPEAVRRADYYRRSPTRFGGESGFKEWMHFCVYGDDTDVLVNFSVVDDVRPAASRHSVRARSIAMVRTKGRWQGGLEEIPAADVSVRGGRIQAQLGPNELRYNDGIYHVQFSCPGHGISGSLRLKPVTGPVPFYNVDAGDGPPIHWVVVPRLQATGHLTTSTGTIRFDRAPAYHDHNWGHFRWGKDFAWEWGFGIPRDPEDPYAFVFSRLSDRGLHRDRMQAVLLWKGHECIRGFRDQSMRLHRIGHFRADRILKVPPIMGLVSQGTSTDVPERLVLEAREGDDHLTAEFTSREISQVILPNDDDDGVTIINEVAGDVVAEGCVRGESVRITCPTIFEFLGC